MPGSPSEASPETSNDRIKKVQTAIDRLRKEDFGLRTDEAVALAAALILKHGANCSEEHLHAKLRSIMEYKEPVPD